MNYTLFSIELINSIGTVIRVQFSVDGFLLSCKMQTEEIVEIQLIGKNRGNELGQC